MGLLQWAPLKPAIAVQRGPTPIQLTADLHLRIAADTILSQARPQLALNERE
jgi:hypothetical protein